MLAPLLPNIIVKSDETRIQEVMLLDVEFINLLFIDGLVLFL